ncbi:MAG: single-stranded DNA-binding protein [Lachnospiraceae bacterium]|nr:single-stranded DNA-binding protein [Lachnospiraceae bacterium]
MNKVILMGRLTRDPDVRYSPAEGSLAYARYTLAVDRRVKRDDNNQTADFISCVTFGKGAEFAEKYLRQGIKIVVTGRIQTGSYTNRDGQKIYTTDVVVEEQEFAESKSAQNGNGQGTGGAASQRSGGATPRQGTGAQGRQREDYRQQSFVDGDGFMNIPDGIDEELPFT